MGNRQDMFRMIDGLRDLSYAIKNLLKKRKLTVTINEKRYNVVGKTGMYHLTIDITGSEVKVGDIVTVDISPTYVDSKIRREYI